MVAFLCVMDTTTVLRTRKDPAYNFEFSFVDQFPNISSCASSFLLATDAVNDIVHVGVFHDYLGYFGIKFFSHLHCLSEFDRRNGCCGLVAE